MTSTMTEVPSPAPNGQAWKIAERRYPCPPGEWDDEPDKLQWVDEATGLDCLIVRNHMSALCGYVGVGPGHPLHGKGYDSVDVDCHGGLTFADACSPSAPESEPSPGICHVPLPGRPHNVWWLGFDCEHYMDLTPGMEGTGLPSGVYRDVRYVIGECADLARQMAASE